MYSIAVILACLSNGECHPVVGEHMLHAQCMSTSMAMLADFHRQNPQYDPSKSRITCAEPRRVQAILGRHSA
jgi:hypothetical protein